MENERVHQGEALRNYLKGTGEKMEYYADQLEMSRQNLNHHLRKQVLDDDFARLIETKLNLLVVDDVVMSAGLARKKNITTVTPEGSSSLLNKLMRLFGKIPEKERDTEAFLILQTMIEEVGLMNEEKEALLKKLKEKK